MNASTSGYGTGNGSGMGFNGDAQGTGGGPGWKNKTGAGDKVGHLRNYDWGREGSGAGTGSGPGSWLNNGWCLTENNGWDR